MQGLRWLSTYKFESAVASFVDGQSVSSTSDGCPMCFWGEALARGQNLNDGLVQTLEPDFLAQEPLAYTAVRRALDMLPCGDDPAAAVAAASAVAAAAAAATDSAGAAAAAGPATGDATLDFSTAAVDADAALQAAHIAGATAFDAKPSKTVEEASSAKFSSHGPTLARDCALAAALSTRYAHTLAEYRSGFGADTGRPDALNAAYAAAMWDVGERFAREEPIVAVLAADAQMELSPWDYWENSTTPRRNGAAARELLEGVIGADGGSDPDNQWAIHLYIHLLEASNFAAEAVPYARSLERIAPAAPHLQHMPSHVFYRAGLWREAVDANYRAVALPMRSATYPEHNMQMLAYALRVEGRAAEAIAVAERLSAFSRPLVESRDRAPLLPHERFGPELALTLLLLGRPEEAAGLPPPPARAPFWQATHHFVRAVAAAAVGLCGEAATERLRLAGRRPAVVAEPAWVYGVFPAAAYVDVATLLARAEAMHYNSTVGCSDDFSPEMQAAAALKEAAAAAAEEDSSGDSLNSDSSSSAGGAGISGGGGGGITGSGGGGTSGGDGSSSSSSGPGAAPAGAAAAVAAAAAWEAVGDEDEVSLLRQAAAIEIDIIGYDEPPVVFFPTRLFLGAALLRRGAPGDAEAALKVYKEDDKRYPDKGWTLFGLAMAADATGDTTAAAEYRKRFERAWERADIELADSSHVILAAAPAASHDSKSRRRKSGGKGDGGGGGGDGGGSDAAEDSSERFVGAAVQAVLDRVRCPGDSAAGSSVERLVMAAAADAGGADFAGTIATEVAAACPTVGAGGGGDGGGSSAGAQLPPSIMAAGCLHGEEEPLSLPANRARKRFAIALLMLMVVSIGVTALAVAMGRRRARSMAPRSAHIVAWNNGSLLTAAGGRNGAGAAVVEADETAIFI